MQMEKRNETCNKKKFTLKQVKGYLAFLKKKGYANTPWRNEVAYYKCDVCKNTYHTSKSVGPDGKTLIKEQSYFDFQKEKWGAWLLNKSHKRGHI